MKTRHAAPVFQVADLDASLTHYTEVLGFSRDFRFGDFVEAFAFMTAAALHAEKLDHHPEWSNVYAKVSVDLVTHDAKGITELDFELARRMNEIANRPT